MIKTTLLFLLKDSQILLAMKKRGYGFGKWNGPGGKADADESPMQAAIRECQEEIGITPLTPKLVGNLRFYERDDPSFCHNCFVFTATKWKGSPIESEEMRPKWFDFPDIPYGQMWPDDELWFPLMLQGKLFKGSVTTDGNNTLISHDITVVQTLTEDA